LEVVGNETFSEEESFTFQSVVFDKESKNLIVERSEQTNKKEKASLRGRPEGYVTIPNFQNPQGNRVCS
jgi:DNA-binding transcriptional MocR family regulator